MSALLLKRRNSWILDQSWRFIKDEHIECSWWYFQCQRILFKTKASNILKNKTALAPMKPCNSWMLNESWSFIKDEHKECSWYLKCQRILFKTKAPNILKNYACSYETMQFLNAKRILKLYQGWAYGVLSKGKWQRLFFTI